MMRSNAFLALSSLSLCACSVSIDVTEEDANATIQADFEGECTGQGSEETELGVVNYVKDSSSGQCQIDIDWAGDLADLGPVRDRIDEDADGRDVTLEEIEIRLKLVQIENNQAVPVDVPTLTNFSGFVALAGVPIYSVDGSSLDALVSEDGLRVRFGDPNGPVLGAVNSALDQATVLSASAEVSLTTTSTLPLQLDNPHRITFSHDIKFSATADLL